MTDPDDCLPLTCGQCEQRHNPHLTVTARFLFRPPVRGSRGTGSPVLVLLCSCCGADILTPQQQQQLEDGTLIDYTARRKRASTALHTDLSNISPFGHLR